MRARVRTMAKGKKGQILTLALLVMFVGAIILGGLFMYMDSSLSLTIKSEDQAVNYYAADSGVEDAIAWLQHEPWSPPVVSLAGWKACDPLSQTCGNDYEINGRNVNVTVENPTGFDNNIFLVTSTATANESARRTTIESYVGVETLDLYKFGADAITSNCDCDTCPDGVDSSVRILGKKGYVQGNVSYVCSIDCNPSPCAVNGTITQDPDGIDWWPDVEDLLSYFGYMATNAVALDSGTLTLSGDSTIGPSYTKGDLTIISEDADANLFLDGIIYIAGDLTIGDQKQDFTLHLGNQTIFAEGSIYVGGRPTLKGSGAIIALEDIYFAPGIDSEVNDFIFIMSVLGGVELQPSGAFWGSVAADGQVDVSPQNIVGHRDPDVAGYVFPGIEPIFDIITYNITKFE